MIDVTAVRFLKKLMWLGADEALNYCFKRLVCAGYEPVQTKGYVYGAGEIPVLLVAHVDTVRTPSQIFYDPRYRVLFGPHGLGADDRAGVALILDVIAKGFRPHVLFTNGEEEGGWGAYWFIADVQDLDVNVILGLDRRGRRHYVCYNCGSPDIRKFLNLFGLREQYGSFSDVAILGPAYNIAIANLAVGFMNEHQNGELLYIDWWNETKGILMQILRNPPRKQMLYGFKYGKKTADYFLPAFRREIYDSYDGWAFIFGLDKGRRLGYNIGGGDEGDG